MNKSAIVTADDVWGNAWTVKLEMPIMFRNFSNMNQEYDFDF